MKHLNGKSTNKVKLIGKVIIFGIITGLIVWFLSLNLSCDVEKNKHNFIVPFEERMVEKHLNASGKVVLKDNQIISSDVKQKIKNVYVSVGDDIKEGDILCEFEDEDIKKNIEMYENKLNVLESNSVLDIKNENYLEEYYNNIYDISLQRAEIQLNNAKNEYNLATNKYNEYLQKYSEATDEYEKEMYYDIYTAYQNQLDDLLENCEQCKNEYEKLSREKDDYIYDRDIIQNIKNLQYSEAKEYQRIIDELRRESEKLIVKAPCNGVISESYISEGNNVENEYGNLFKIGNPENYHVELCINAKNILDVYEGMYVDLMTAMTGSEIIKGKITKVYEVFDENGYKADVEILDANQGSKLKSNVSVSAKIYLENRGKVPAVPYDSVFDGDDGKNYVYRAQIEGNVYLVEKVRVEVGLEADFYVEVKDTDLNIGDLVIGNAASYYEGQKLRIE